MKFDTTGIGYHESVLEKQSQCWWEDVYNKTAGNIVPSKEKNQKEKHSVGEGKSNKRLTDEELFEICGGRTAHKSSRHGHNLTKKLKRIEQEEQVRMLQENVEKINSEDKIIFENINENKKKRRKNK